MDQAVLENHMTFFIVSVTPLVNERTWPWR